MSMMNKVLNALRALWYAFCPPGIYRRGPLYRHVDSGKLYIREDRAGYNCIAQDWWQEVEVVGVCLVRPRSAWKKYNVGYPARDPKDTFPWVELTKDEVNKLEREATAARVAVAAP